MKNCAPPQTSIGRSAKTDSMAIPSLVQPTQPKKTRLSVLPNAVVAAPPDIDASNAGWLRAVLLEAAARGDATFVVDMTATQFCDSAGLGVLVRAHKRALADGGELRLVIPASAMVRRVFALTGIDRVIPNFPGPERGAGTGACRRCPAAAPPTAHQAGDAPGRTGRRAIPAPAPARPDGPPRSRAGLGRG
jgi:anti-sigma B factor antagonist